LIDYTVRFQLKLYTAKHYELILETITKTLTHSVKKLTTSCKMSQHTMPTQQVNRIDLL